MMGLVQGVGNLIVSAGLVCSLVTLVTADEVGAWDPEVVSRDRQFSGLSTRYLRDAGAGYRDAIRWAHRTFTRYRGITFVLSVLATCMYAVNDMWV
jgi:hypothetical protein